MENVPFGFNDPAFSNNFDNNIGIEQSCSNLPYGFDDSDYHYIDDESEVSIHKDVEGLFFFIEGDNIFIESDNGDENLLIGLVEDYDDYLEKFTNSNGRVFIQYTSKQQEMKAWLTSLLYSEEYND